MRTSSECDPRSVRLEREEPQCDSEPDFGDAADVAVEDVVSVRPMLAFTGESLGEAISNTMISASDKEIDSSTYRGTAILRFSQPD
jgi:hypothetical protein